jgi:hypothetical protein
MHVLLAPVAVATGADVGVPGDAAHYVLSSSFDHTNGCTPGDAQERVLGRVSTSGCKVPVHVLAEMASAMRMHPDTRQIRLLLASHKIKLPADDAQSICNLKLAVARKVAKGEIITQDLDLDDDRFHDDLGALFQAEFQRNVEEQTAGEIVSLLEHLRTEIEGFDYRVQAEQQGEKLVARSVIWQTARMRARLRMYGQALFFDGKDKANEERWPIFLHTVVTPNKKIGRGAVGLSLEEDGVALRFMLESMKSMTPGWTDAPTIFMDGKLSERDVLEVFPPGHAMICTWHWLALNLSKNLGNLPYYDDIKKKVYEMIEADHVSLFDEIWRGIQRDHPSATTYLQTWVDIRHRWATCMTEWYTMGTNVTSFVEASNASFVSFALSACGSGAIKDNVETSMRQERTTMALEQVEMDDEEMGHKRKRYADPFVDAARDDLAEAACDRLANEYHESGKYEVTLHAESSTVTRNGKSHTVVWNDVRDQPTCTCHECAKWCAPCRHALAHARAKGWGTWKQIAHTYHVRWNRMSQMVLDPVADPDQSKSDKISYLGGGGGGQQAARTPDQHQPQQPPAQEESQRTEYPRDEEGGSEDGAAAEVVDPVEAPRDSAKGAPAKRWGPKERYNYLQKLSSKLSQTMDDICKNGAQSRSNEEAYVITHTILVRLCDMLAHVDTTNLQEYGESLSRSIARALQPFGHAEEKKALASRSGGVHDPAAQTSAGRPGARFKSGHEPKQGLAASTCSVCGVKGHKQGNKDKCEPRKAWGELITATHWKRRADELPGLSDLWMGDADWERASKDVEYEGTTPGASGIPSGIVCVVIQAAYVHNAQSKIDDGNYLCIVSISKKGAASRGTLRIAHIEKVRAWHNGGRTGGGKYAYIGKPAMRPLAPTTGGEERARCNTCLKEGSDMVTCGTCEGSVHAPGQSWMSTSSGDRYCCTEIDNKVSCEECEFNKVDTPRAQAAAGAEGPGSGPPRKKKRATPGGDGEERQRKDKTRKTAKAKDKSAPAVGVPAKGTRTRKPSAKSAASGEQQPKRKKPSATELAFQFTDAQVQAAIDERREPVEYPDNY